MKRLSKKLSDVLTTVNSVSEALGAVQQYSYHCTLWKLLASRRLTRRNLQRIQLISFMSQTLFVSGHWRYMFRRYRHRVPGRTRAAENKPEPIICDFVRRLVNEKVMAANRTTRRLSAADLCALPLNVLESTTIWRLSSRNFFTAPITLKPNFSYQYCWTKNKAVFLRKKETSRPVKLTKMDDLTKLSLQSQAAARSDE